MPIPVNNSADISGFNVCSKYKIIKIIGSGAYGQVALAIEV